MNEIKIKDIINEAKEELIIASVYADKTVLDMLTNEKIKKILIVKQNSKY